MLNFDTSISKKCGECKMQFVNTGFNIFKMNDSICVQMLII
jgi:hypothetical protein